MSALNKQPPDFSSWKGRPRLNAFWNPDEERPVPSYQDKIGSFPWWGHFYFYEHPSNPDICGVAFEPLGKEVVLKTWGFRDDENKAIAALIDGKWRVVDDARGEDIDIEADLQNGKIIRIELKLIRADKTVIGKTVITI